MFNPPGPLGLGGQPYDPFRFGPSPIYGFIEFDIDNCNDTGGELGGAATLRYLANASRFGGLPTGATSAGRAIRATTSTSTSTPIRSSNAAAKTSRWRCRCFPVSLISVDTHTWIVQSRYFQRAGGYREASGVFSRSAQGLYDPIVKIRFQQDPDPGTNTTTITLVYPLTMHGAALLGLQTDPPIDHIIDIGGNPSSVVEALSDIIEHSDNLEGPVWDLTHLWVNRNATDYLDPTLWNATAIFGTAYATPQANALYVWTDVGFSQTVGDVTGDGLADSADRNALVAYINAHDGDDGVIDSTIAIPNFGANFSLYDINYDGVVDSHDLMIYPATCARTGTTMGM